MISNEARKIIDNWSKKTKLKVDYFENGIRIHPKLERKGAYVKELNDLDNDLPIVNEAIVKYLIDKIDVEDTINSCDELIKFQKVVRVSSNYKMAWHNGQFFKDKTFRVFASTNYKDTYIGKLKYEGATIEKFGDTPDKCFIDNSDINNKMVPEYLDKNWYIALAKKRLGDKFGLDVNDSLMF